MYNRTKTILLALASVAAAPGALAGFIHAYTDSSGVVYDPTSKSFVYSSGIDFTGTSYSDQLVYGQPRGGASVALAIGGSAVASVDVTRGALHASAVAPAVAYNVYGNYDGRSYATAAFSDLVTVHGDFSQGGFVVHLTAHLDGWMQGGTTDEGGNYPSTLDFYADAGFGEQRHSFTAPGGMPNTRIQVAYDVAAFVAPISATAGTFSIYSYLSATAFNSGKVDFGNTAQFSLHLPQDYTQTSELGFLSVPEPGAYAVVAALGLLAFGVRRRIRRG